MRGVLAATAAILVPGGPLRADHLLVADCLDHKVARYDERGGYLGDFVAPGSGGVAVPHSMAWGPDANGDGARDLYVAANDSSAVHLYDGRTGDPIGGGVFVSLLVFDARDLEWGPDRNGDGAEDLYVLNHDTVYRVVWFDGTSGALGGVFVNVAAGPGWWDAEFMEFGPDADGDGVPELYGTSASAPYVYRFDGATGAFVDVFVNEGEGLQNPRELTFHTDGRLYVCHAPADSIVRFDAGERGAAETFVSPGSGGLDLPHGLRFGPDANGDGVSDLYVAGEFSAGVTRHDGITGELIDVFVSEGIGAAASVLFLDTCTPDLDESGAVGVPDLLALLAAWGKCAGCPEDLDGDGGVGIADLLALLGDWGPCP